MVIRMALAIALLSLVPVAASAQGGNEQEWTATSSQIQGNTTACPVGGAKVRMRTDGKTLSMWSANGERLRWRAPVKSDGSIDAETDYTGDRITGRARIKAPAGNGPRPVEFLYLRDVCGYRFDP